MRELKKTCKTTATYEMYDCKTRHVVRLLGAVRMSDLTHEKVLDYTEKREAETAHPHTVHRELTALRQLLQSAKRAGEFGGDIKSVIPKYAARYVPRTRWLTLDELLRVTAELPRGRAAVLAFEVATSANMGEAFRAERGDFDFQAGGIHIRGTKRETRNRTVPFLAHVWPLLAFVLEHADGEGEMLFQPWQNIRRDILDACRRASVCRGCRLAGRLRPSTPCLACRASYLAPLSTNDLRRTCATWMVKRGTPLNLAAKILGHKSLAMLTKVYGQLDHADVGRLINAHMGDSRGTEEAAFT